ncbi:MAG TPA: transglycosylase domain-containing protein [Acidimicrobiales bacterium]|nr:transglycosylase domain-containing protein [Acidimicrobiales bacterium]
MALFWRIVKRIFSSMFLATVTLVGAPAVFGITVLAGLVFLPLPATIPIPTAKPAILPTVIYDRFGNQIATLRQFDTNIPVTEAEIPQVLKEAVIADEDRNYYHHGGVDLRGLVRALWADLRNRSPVQGGSTITQQYVKLAYTNQQRTIVRKVREAILASQLARQASKDDILYRYLTLVYFGDGNYGIGAAAQNYFHIPVNQLNVSQAAALAGLIPAPSARAPRENLASAEYYRQLVLKKMFQQGYLTGPQYQSALAQKLALASTGQVPPGSTVVYPYQAGVSTFPDFVDYVTRWLLQRFPAQEVYSGGLRVQTTLDPAVQNAALAAVHQTLAGTKDPLEMAMAAVEPSTGFVTAIVGGRDFGGQSPYAQDNLAIGGCDPVPAKTANVAVSATCWSGKSISGGTPGRQPGSSWKPFVLATAFEQGIQPTAGYSAPGVYQIPGCKVLPGQQASTCQVHNDEPGSVIGSETLAQATAASTNTVYAQVAPQVGCPNVATTAKKLGIDSAYYSTPPFYYCSTYALGEVDVSPLDMASAYGVFANHGQRAEPTPVLEIVDAQGKVLLNNINPLPSTTSVLPANVADNVTNVLQGVIAGGTGTAAQLGRPAAGKTGTTSSYTNAWFAGYTPTLSAAVWMGNADSQAKPMGVVKGVYPVYGGTWPAITWRNFMGAALAKVPATPFSQPAPITPPQAAPALQVHGPPTTAAVEPGEPGFVAPTPAGGPYRVPAPTPVAPPPATTTTVPGQETTTTVPSGGPPNTPFGGPLGGGGG